MKDCCKVPSNLTPEPSESPDITVSRCTVCGSRHFELEVEAGQIGLKF